MSLEPHAAEAVILETQAALDEKAKLKKHFGRFDMLFFLICTLVGVDTLGAVASNGARGLHVADRAGRRSSSSRTRC